MTFPLEYHKDVESSVQPLIPASLALCGALLLPLLLVSSSPAQANNTSASSTHASVPASSAAPAVRNVSAPDKSVVVIPPKPHPPQPPIHNPNGNNSSQHNPSGVAYYPYFYPVPYAVDASAADADTTDAGAPNANAADASNDSGNDNNNDPEYQGGPTIFDRRGPGTASYIASASPAQSSAEQAQAEAADSDPEPPQAPTILVFRDGHQLEVTNYAIITPTLYDLTAGHPRKIALSALDLAATEKLNDDHGIVFELPSSAQAN